MASGSPTRSQPNSFGLTDVGRVRTHNEDTFLAAPEMGLYLVADGMGGHQAGDVASAMIRLSIANFFEVTTCEQWPDAYRDDSDAELSLAAQRLAAAVRKANNDVFVAASDFAAHYGMGSTVVAAHLPEDLREGVAIAHVGDSRCYRIRDGALELLTSDHSLVNEALAIDPNMSEEEIARLPTNIITRALGMDAQVEVEMGMVDAQKGDVLLLCSDGLTGLVTDDEIMAAVELAEDADDACQLLVALANEAGGLDNVTALVIAL